MSIPFMKSIAFYLAFAMFVIGITPKADASFAPSGIITLAQTDRAADLATVQKTLELKMVKERLAELGFTHEEIQSRLTQLSDQQLHRTAQQLDGLKVGGDGLGVVIAILVIAILVVLLIQLTGHRVIVK
ncbi:MAG: PA2779 family protein [Nitrospiraceae bacterium]|nr:PA2779 family protein [Nitrospiraceae bacterium]